MGSSSQLPFRFQFRLLGAAGDFFRWSGIKTPVKNATCKTSHKWNMVGGSEEEESKKWICQVYIKFPWKGSTWNKKPRLHKK